jgi:uncharacterized protein (UPF0264 family)
MTGLLASVATLDEAALALELGADIVDLKDPAKGALGAWTTDRLQEAVRRFGDRGVLSATTGDLPMTPSMLVRAARETAATGVRYVKVGFFKGGDHPACAAALAPLAAGGLRLVAVMMADQQPEFALLPVLAQAGFAGAMLDTADKRAGGLMRHQSGATLVAFVAEARRMGLMSGLAGSLSLADIPALAAPDPDYLGFRGALCRGDRTGSLDPASFRKVRAALSKTRLAA